MTLDELFNIINDRQQKMPEGSYIASLFKAGQDRIIQKIGEEAIEVVIEAKNKDKKRIIAETADLWFHLLILLASLGIKPDDILKEFDIRSK